MAWKVGDEVSVGMLKGLKVTGQEEHDGVVRFTLEHGATGKQYSFIPGGLRKTFTPEPPQLTGGNELSTKLIDHLQDVLRKRLRRTGDEGVRKEVKEALRILQVPDMPQQQRAG